MLKNIEPFVTADMLWVLASMGHGDELAVVDRNFSGARVASKTTSAKLVELPGINATLAISAILKLMPLDNFVDAPLRHMEAVEFPGAMLEVHRDVLEVCEKIEGRKISSKPIERLAYYPLAMNSFAVIQTGEQRPYGNFILKKGVVSS